jgi:Leucine-rich repeat (LRR) protein
LTKITRLDFSNQPLLKDISSVKVLNALEWFEVYRTPVEDISALKDSLNLHTLILHNTKVKDLSALSGKNIKLDALRNDLRWCSPKKWDDLIKGVSCYEKDGTEKSWWKRLLRL